MSKRLINTLIIIAIAFFIGYQGYVVMQAEVSRALACNNKLILHINDTFDYSGQEVTIIGKHKHNGECAYEVKAKGNPNTVLVPVEVVHHD